MGSLTTFNRHGFSVKFSPFNPAYLTVASSENFGLRGKGTLFVLDVVPNGKIRELESRHWSDGLFDVAWSEVNSNHILTASGDGSLQLWDLNIKEVPIKTFQRHYGEISSIDWSHKNIILSASWDTSLKLWDPVTTTCINSFLGSVENINKAAFSTFIPNLFASVSDDGHMKLWDLPCPHSVASFRTHDSEVLSCDWSKHDAHLIATCGSDSLIRGWDIRNYRQPVFQLKGSNQAVKQIRFSPHFLNILASVSFDCTTNIWDFRKVEPLEIFKHHSRYVYGLDWNPHILGELADCSWDQTIRVFASKHLKNIKNKI